MKRFLQKLPMPCWRPGRRKAGARLDTRLPAAVLVYILVVTDAAADGEGEGEGDWPIFSKVHRQQIYNNVIGCVMLCVCYCYIYVCMYVSVCGTVLCACPAPHACMRENEDMHAPHTHKHTHTRTDTRTCYNMSRCGTHGWMPSVQHTHGAKRDVKPHAARYTSA